MILVKFLLITFHIKNWISITRATRDDSHKIYFGGYKVLLASFACFNIIQHTYIYLRIEKKFSQTVAKSDLSKYEVKFPGRNYGSSCKFSALFSREILDLSPPGKEELAFQRSPKTCNILGSWSILWNILTRDRRVDRSGLTSDLIVARLNSFR